MSSILISGSTQDIPVYEELSSLSKLWKCTLETLPKGYILLPDYMLRIHGISIEEETDGWMFFREPDATTWEDFLLMHFTHRIAAQHGRLLYYHGGDSLPVEPTPDQFSTFDLYVERVLKNSEGVVKEMKKNWIYQHQKRHVR